MNRRITRRRALTGLAALGGASLLLPRGLAGQVSAQAPEPVLTFEIKYGNAVPAAAREMFSKAADAWGKLLKSRVPVRLEVEWDTGTPGVRMVHTFPGSPKPGVYHPSALANRFVGQRVDLNLPDARIVFGDFGFAPVRWNFSPVGPVAPDEVHFFTIALVEIHSALIGLPTFYVEDEGVHLAGPSARLSVYDYLVTDVEGTPLATAHNEQDGPERLFREGIFLDGPEIRKAGGPWRLDPTLGLLADETGVTCTMASIVGPEVGRGYGYAVPAPGAPELAMLLDAGWGAPLTLAQSRGTEGVAFAGGVDLLRATATALPACKIEIVSHLSPREPEPATLGSGASAAATAPASPKFTFEYGEGISKEFRATVEAAAAEIGRHIHSSVNIWADIILDTGLGGFAGTLFRPEEAFAGALPGVLYPAALANRIAGKRLSGETDLAIFVSRDVNWDLSKTVDSGGRPSLFRVMMHEIGHGLGHSSRFQLDSSTGRGSIGSYPGDGPTIADQFLVSAAGVPLLDLADDPARLGAALRTGIYFAGPNARWANGGAPVRLFLFGGLHEFPSPTCSAAYHVMDPTPGFEGAFQPETLIGMLTDLGWGAGDAAPPPKPQPRIPSLAHD